MKKTILMAVLLAGTVFAGNASAATTTIMYGTFNINVSPDIGSGTFGTITVTDNGGGSALVTETITNPNFIINSGNHTPLTFSLVGGTIDASSLTASYSIDTSPFTNPPFSNQLNFNAGIDGPGCTGGSSPGCGTMLSFIIDNYDGILGQDFTSGGVISTIFFATDLSDPTLWSDWCCWCNTARHTNPACRGLVRSGSGWHRFVEACDQEAQCPSWCCVNKTAATFHLNGDCSEPVSRGVFAAQ